MARIKPGIRVCINVGIAAALMAVCSWISVPLIVPFTMQTFAVFTIVGLLGIWQGTCAVCVYVALGAIGVPVFSGFRGGIAALTGATGGYIIGFIALALVMGAVIKIKPESRLWAFIGMALGLFAC